MTDVDNAFEALARLEWGSDLAPLAAIDAACRAARSDPSALGRLEERLAAVARGPGPRAARDAACRRLGRIGSAACVPALEGLLADDDLAHMARFALERLPCPEATGALLRSLPAARGRLAVGILNSLGARRDPRSVPGLRGLLSAADPEVAAAAAAALGEVGVPDAVAPLLDSLGKAPGELRAAAGDACLACAERLTAAGSGAAAAEVYRALLAPALPERIRRAAERALPPGGGGPK